MKANFDESLETMPEVDEDEAVGRFIAAGKFIREWQEAQLPKLSDGGLLQRYPKLASTKTFKRAWSGDTDDLANIATKWLPAYEDVMRLIQAEMDESAEPVYTDLPFLAPIMESVGRLMMSKGIKRLIIIEGDTGHGKSAVLRALKKKYGDRAVLAEADESWARGKSAVGQLSVACGVVDNDRALAWELTKRINALVDHIKGRKLILIDEVHHSGAGFLNILKTLINRTNSVFVVAGMKTLLDKLSALAQQEARQLTHNRLFARHTLTGPGVEDAKVFLGRRLKLDPNKKTEEAIAALIATKSGNGRAELVAAHLGGMAFLRNVADTCDDMVGAGSPIDGGTLIAAAQEVKKQATGR